MLPDLMREAVVLLVASACEAPFIWVHDQPIARRAGLTDEQVEGICLGHAPDDVDAATATAISLGQVLTRTHPDQAAVSSAVGPDPF
ncbi:hypothetical protein [Micromonospora sp. NPDC005206]|uniref:hypothetical protein n=1 Tax=Micromonospora sp. NPDC005206 TaxID=3157022 RepID=UPI0033B43BC9